MLKAALTKLSYVLSKADWSLEEKRLSMMSNLRGEMTVLNVKEISHTRMLEDGDDDDIAGGGSELELIRAVAKSLSIKTSDELEGVEAALFPAILCSAVFKGSLDTLEAMRTNYGADLTAADYDKRTPLHVAASEGNMEVVEYLLRHGASVHARDRHDDSPLSSAIHAGNKNVIE